MAQQASRPLAVQWYSISLSSVRRVAVLLVIVSGLIGGSLLYQRWEHLSLRDRTESTIQKATDLTRRVERRDAFEQIRIEHSAAWEDLEVARSEFAAERYRPALERAERSLTKLQSVLHIGQGPQAGRSRFVSIQGGVEYRRGERGAWKRARSHDVLNPGDWVKTSPDGTAEIRLPDRSKYVLRRNSMIRLGVSRNLLTSTEEPDTRVEFGWVDVNTSRRPSKVTTPKSQARVRMDSEAQISFDPDQGASRIATYRGSAEVVASNGQTRELGALQQVEQVGDLLSAPKAIPDRPKLLQPTDDQQIDLASRQLSLTWSPDQGAYRYNLQVSRSPLFAPNIVADDNRRKTSAKLGLRGEGIFYWQVAAIDREGAKGPWSEPQALRVAALKRPEEVEDDVPPELGIEDMQAYGSLVIVNGRTEPGAAVQINEEPVSVQVDGSFSKTIQMKQVGFAFMRIVATDAWDNPTEVKRRVFIDAF